MKELSLLKEEIEKCVRCGTCRSVCPTFKAIGRETASARGKLTLIDAYLKGDLGHTDTYIKHIKECTLCGACRENCPNGVKTTAIITAARAEYAEKKGMPFAASLIFKNLLDTGKLMPLALKAASRLHAVLFKDSSIENGLISRFSLPVIGNGRLLPNLAKTFFLDLPAVKEAGNRDLKATGRPKIAFYAGCGVNYLMPDLGLTSLDVLKRAGTAVIVPSGQVCCGMPAYSMGDVATAKKMALKNLEVFESYDFDFITTSCATCGYGLKKLFRDLLGDDPETRQRVEALSSKVRDITELLAGELGFIGKGKNNSGSQVVTYHDACHLGRNQGVREEPRELLSAASGVKLKEMKNPCSCCGLGGGLSLSNYELSMEIIRKKVENIKRSGASGVATACPGCMVQLRDGLHRFGVDTKVAHVIEFL